MSAILGAPWRWDEDLDEVLEANGNTVAYVPEAYGSFGPALAAVPELVAVVDALVRLEAAQPELREDLGDIVDDARAALAKAKGGGA